MADSEKAILGKFKGECADAGMTNKNGVDITYDVWNNVFNSEDYKTGIELGHYIGFLGHPEDPACQDFEHACIVMTDGSITDDNIVHGEFNLVDTPVGRIVRSFQKAGVTFGISVRGAGDIVGNSVDPDTFDFRGFDLVTFPAYPNAIPEFTEIAASTDSAKRKQYQTICAAVESELDNIDDPTTLESLKGMFPEQSDTYGKIDEKLGCVAVEDDVVPSDVERIDCDPSPREELLEMQRDSMVMLWKETAEDLRTAERLLEDEHAARKKDALVANRKLRAMRRICADQNSVVESYSKQSEVMASKISKLQGMLESQERKYVSACRKLERANERMSEIESKYRAAITASTKVRSEADSMSDDIDQLVSERDRLEQANLHISQKIDASERASAEKDAVIASLREELRETIESSESMHKRASNLEAANARLEDNLEAYDAVIGGYQDAYANLYANALGTSLHDVPVTASTSVEDLQKLIRASAHLPFEADEPHLEDAEAADEDSAIVYA